MKTELTTAGVTDSHQAPALLWPELPQCLTESELRNPFRLDTTRENDVLVSRKIFIPPSESERRQLAEISGALERRLEPSTPDFVLRELARIANHHKTDRSASEWQALYEDYLGDLREFSNAHVSQAIAEHRRQSKWFPKVVELRQRCLELQELDRIRLRRVKVSLTGQDARP